MKILKQLFKEFCIPLTISLLWVAYGLLGQPIDVWLSVKTVNAMFVTFFGLSFWFSQWNRVKKQLRVEEGLAGIEGKLSAMIESLDEKTLHLIDNITGGDSFCYAYPMMVQPGTIMWTFIHSGKAPLYDVQVRIHDGRKPTLQASKNLSLGTLFPSRAHDYPASLGSTEVRTPSQAFNLFFVGRNGSWTQEIRWVEMPGVLAVANRVVRDGMPITQPLLFEVSKDYPGEAQSDSTWSMAVPGLVPIS